MISLPAGSRIWLVAGITDMRNGFNGLASKVQNVLKDDPFSGHLFIFRGRRGDQIKVLWADSDGLCLFTKRLERGRFVWPVTRNAGSQMPPAVWFAYSPDRKGIHPQNHLAGYSGVLQADAYGGYRALYESGRITEAACMAHARRKIHDVHARAPTYITTEALQRIGELYAIEAEVRGCSAEQRLAARKARAAPLMQSLYDWIQQQMKTLSRHSDTAKAFAYLLKQWDALNVYCSNGWVEIDNNIAENALRGVAVGRKNWMFAGSDSGGEHAAVLYSLIGTCRLNNVEPEKWLRYVIEHIQDWPANRVRDLLPWKVDLSSQ
ncbi:TPA: IS66 family transposase [Escherichia coli]|nr:IS66 family transposase [Escherichia coli]